MQLLKYWLVRCAAILCLCAISGRAADTDAQIKAREALRQKLDELQAQPGAVVTPPAETPAETMPVPAPKKPAKRVQKPAPAPEETPKVAEPSAPRPIPPASFQAPAPHVKSKPVPREIATPSPIQSQPTAIPVHDSAAIEKAREAVRQKMAELPVEPEPAPVEPAAPPVVKKEKPAKVKPAPVAKTEKPAKIKPAPKNDNAANFEPMPGSSSPVVATPPASKPTKQSKPRKAAEQAAQTEANVTEPAAKTQKAPKPQKPVVTQNTNPSNSRFKPLQGPATNLSPDKEQKLTDLLRRYQADEITPTQYHQERAKILAAP